MKIDIPVFLSLIITLLTGIWLGVKIHERIHRAKMKRMRLSMDIFDLTTCHGALEELRQGRISNAIEFCESGLDFCVCRFWHEAQHAHKTVKGDYVSGLKRIKEYRQQWPRQITTNEYLSKKESQEVAEEARKILAGL